MKKIVLSALIAIAPLSFALAGEEAADKKADAAASSNGAAAAEFPSWDTRKAGESIDLGDSKSKDAAEK